MMLDERLSTVYNLYPECNLAADIGTDHGLLPCALLESGKCRNMILTDISEKALQHAREETFRRRLSDRATLCCGNGLEPLVMKCDAISITGMGGRTVSRILLDGRMSLHNATLLLSAHTDLPTVRETLVILGYKLAAEKLCKAAGRFYLVFKAIPGLDHPSDQEIRLGSLLFSDDSPYLSEYLLHRKKVLEEKLTGMSSVTDSTLSSDIVHLHEDITYLEEKLKTIHS